MNRIFVVTGAPGGGKSTTLEEFIKLNSECVAFDIDWLTESASELANKDVIFDESTWKPYRKVWFEVLHSVLKNNKIPIFFAAIDKNDVSQLGELEWCDRIEWLLLDCNDEVRRERLAKRENWNSRMIDDAMIDAKDLRASIKQRIDTKEKNPKQVAEEILSLITTTLK